MASPTKKRGTLAKATPRNCFVLMPFEEGFNELYAQSIRPTVSKTKILKCLRADEILGPSQITKDIWRSIKESKLVIADLTGHNPNVFYELGLAHAIQKPVILLTQDKLDDVPFDVKHIRVIKYNNNGIGRRKLMIELDRALREVLRMIEDKSLPKRYILLEPYGELEIDGDKGLKNLLGQLRSNDPNKIVGTLSKITNKFRYKEKTKNCDLRILKEVLKNLNSSFPEVQSAAIQALSVVGGRIHGSHLHSFLSSENQALAEEAIIALGELQDCSAIPQLLTMFNNADYQQRRRAVLQALTKIGGREIISFYAKIAANDEADLFLREIAIRNLGELSEDEAISALLDLNIDSLNTDLRYELAKALAELRVIYPTQIRMLEKSLGKLLLDKLPEVRGSALAAWCLQSLEDSFRVLDRNVLWDHLWKENENALFMFFLELSEFETSFSTEESSELVRLAEEYPRFRSEIIFHLKDIGDSSISSFMIRAFNESVEDQLKILSYLGRVPSRDAVKLLHNEIQEKENPSRTSLAAMALSKLGEQDTIDLLLESVVSSHKWIKADVRKYLEEYAKLEGSAERRKKIGQVIKKLPRT